MDLRRFIDLYVTEAQEHIGLLQRSLVALEQGTDPGVLDEAFRAAHTLKGLSAAMGYGQVADQAHRLEDRLDQIRSHRLVPDAALMDELLAQADALEAAVTASTYSPPDTSAAPAANAVPARDAPALRAAPPAGTTHIAVVQLHPDAPLRSARALLIQRSVAGTPGVLGFDPAAPEEDFDGVLRVFLGAGADVGALQRTLSMAGDVAHVRIASAAPAAAVARRQVRVDAQRLDALAEGIGELTLLQGRIALPDAPPGMAEALNRMGLVLAALRHEVLALRMVPVRDAFERLPRVVRDAGRSVGRDVDLQVEGADVELDRAILDEIGEPFVHLLRNAVDHGIEEATERVAAGKPARGRIRVAAERERSSVCIVVEDDGRGVDARRLLEKAREAGLDVSDASAASDEGVFRLMSHPGLSTAERVTGVSGRGVGMDVVVSRIRALGGAIAMRTEPGRGTTFTIRLPFTLSLAQALRVRVGGEDYAIPLTHVTEAVELNGNLVEDGGEAVRVRGDVVPLVRLRRILQVPGAGTESAAVIAEIAGRRAALAVDELVGSEQILVKSFDAAPGMLPFFSGATLLPDGRPALVLDPMSVI